MTHLLQVYAEWDLRCAELLASLREQDAMERAAFERYREANQELAKALGALMGEGRE